jgi:integrase
LEKQKITYSADILFLDWIDKWMEQKRNNIRLNSFEAYESYLAKHIQPFFRYLKLTLREITAQHIQDYYDTMQNKGLSSSSIRKHNAVISGALQEAVKKNILAYDISKNATLPAKTRFIGKAYTEEQARNLLAVIDREPIKPAIILGLFYGLRRSEVLGLRWRDVDFGSDTIHICNTVVKTKTLIEHEQTKSMASKRTLYIIPETRDYLFRLRQEQEARRTLLENAYHAGDHVCVWDDGSPFSPDYISRKFSKILKASGFPPLRFHELRHTAGSLLLAKGLSAKQIQEYLGHEQVATTLDIYGHLSIEGKKEASNIIGGLLSLKDI